MCSSDLKVPTKKQDKINTEKVADVSPKPIEKGIVSKNLVTTKEQRKALSYIVNDIDIRDYLRGIHIDEKKKNMVATDGYRIAVLHNANFSDLPANPKGYTVIDAKDNWIEGKYPDYERVVPKHYGNKMLVDAAPMGDYARGVARASKFLESKYPEFRIKIGDQTTGVNAKDRKSTRLNSSH